MRWGLLLLLSGCTAGSAVRPSRTCHMLASEPAGMSEGCSFSPWEGGGHLSAGGGPGEPLVEATFWNNIDVYLPDGRFVPTWRGGWYLEVGELGFYGRVDVTERERLTVEPVRVSLQFWGDL